VPEFHVRTAESDCVKERLSSLCRSHGNTIA
jgi:hypothetical protein